MVHWTTEIFEMVTEMFLGIAQKICCQFFYCLILSNDQIFLGNNFFFLSFGRWPLLIGGLKKNGATSKTFPGKDQKHFKWHSKNLVIDYGN
jgi:hypothetical protein